MEEMMEEPSLCLSFQGHTSSPSPPHKEGLQAPGSPAHDHSPGGISPRE